MGSVELEALFSSTDESSGSESEEAGEEEAPAQKDATVVDAGVSDMEYLRSRMTSKFEESASDDEVQHEDVEDAGAVTAPELVSLSIAVFLLDLLSVSPPVMTSMPFDVCRCSFYATLQVWTLCKIWLAVGHATCASVLQQADLP